MCFLFFLLLFLLFVEFFFFCFRTLTPQREPDPHELEALGIPKIKISATFDFAISAAELSPDVCSTCLGMSHAKPYLLRPFLEGDPSEMVLKVCVLDGAVMKKSTKTLRESDVGLSSHAPASQIKLFGTRPRRPRCLTIGWHRLLIGPPFHTRRGPG